MMRWLAGGMLLGALLWGTGDALLQMHAEQAGTTDCTALSLDRETGRTVAGPCLGTTPRLPSTLTALLPAGLPEHVAAAR